MARFLLTVRESVSLLLANGHANAQQYPLNRIFMEADIVRRRLRHQHAEASVLMNLAVGALLGDQGHQNFQKQIREMTGDGR